MKTCHVFDLTKSRKEGCLLQRWSLSGLPIGYPAR